MKQQHAHPLSPQSYALRQLTTGAPLVPAPQAMSVAPDAPGLYAIFVDSATSLPDPFGAILAGRDTTLIYLGKAGGSLRRRLCEEELRHRRRATFFRSLGAALGYRPVPGSLAGRKNGKNYTFSPADTAALVAWSDARLSVRWVALPKATAEAWEPALIAHLRPLLNLTGNPARLRELEALREECRRVAVVASRGSVDAKQLAGDVVEAGEGRVNAGGLAGEVQVEGAEEKAGVGG